VTLLQSSVQVFGLRWGFVLSGWRIIQVAPRSARSGEGGEEMRVADQPESAARARTTGSKFKY